MNSIFISFLASFLIWLMLGGLIFLWIVDGKVKKEQVLHAIAAILVAWMISSILKDLVPTVRPFKINGYPPLTLTVPQDGAFPSNHSAIAFSMATSLWLHKKRLGWVFLIGALLVGLGRVLANVHYIFDIFGGAIIGMACAYTIDKLHLHKLVKGGRLDN